MSKTQHLWRCPRCRATSHKHGHGPCLRSLTEGENCDGFLCHCEAKGFDGLEVFKEDHGRNETNPCHNARCDHCGWNGTYPANGLDIAMGSIDTTFDPSTLTGWAKEAFEAGWTPPPNWKP